MFDMVLFATVGLLLVALVFFLVVIVRDHLKSRHYDLPTALSEEMQDRQEVVTFEKPKRVA